MTPALLDLGSHDDDLVRRLAERAVRLSGHEPHRPVERARRLEAHRGATLVADDDQGIRPLRPQHELQRLLRPARGLRRVERGAAPGVQDPSLGQPPVGRHRPQPLRLREDRAPRFFPCHARSI